MVREDLLIGSLRIPIRELQELLTYLESRGTLSPEDLAYCNAKVNDLLGQLRVFRRVSEFELRRATLQEPISWN